MNSQNWNGSTSKIFLVFVIQQDSNAEEDLRLFQANASWEVKFFSTATLVEVVKREERRVWLLEYLRNKRVWLFLDYEESNATNLSANLDNEDSIKNEMISMATLKPEMTSTLRDKGELELRKNVKTYSSRLNLSNHHNSNARNNLIIFKTQSSQSFEKLSIETLVLEVRTLECSNGKFWGWIPRLK